MSDTLPSPPISRSASPTAEDNDDLVAKLDILLEQYLELLDQYTRAREALAKSMSSGFLSLAHAQRTSTLGAGRRYGQDFYDERMKAQRRVKFRQEPDQMRLSVETVVPSRSTEAGNYEQVKEAIEKVEIVNDSARSGSTQAKEAADKPKSKTDPADRDPVKWFGFSTPQPLRQCQSSFVSVLEHSLPELVHLDSLMKSLEAEIWTTRADLGILHQYDAELQVRSTTQHTEAAENSPETVVSPPDGMPSKRRHTFKPLASHPTHAKSSLLKLGD